MSQAKYRSAFKLFTSYVVAYMEDDSGKRHRKILEPHVFLSPDKAWAEIHGKGLGIGSAGNKAAVKEAGVGEEEAPGPGGGKGRLSDSCEIMENGR